MTQKEHDKKINELRVSLVEAEQKIKDVRNELDELNNVKIEPESRRWKPKSGEIYYFMDSSGYIISDRWTCGNNHELRYDIGNCFKTYEEAKFELERLKVIAELKEFAEPEDREWDGRKNHYHISNCAGTKTIEISGNSLCKVHAIYFESREKAEEAIKAVGEDRIKKYYLRVKED